MPKKTLLNADSLSRGDVIVSEAGDVLVAFTVDTVIDGKAYLTAGNKTLSSKERQVYDQAELTERAEKAGWRLANLPNVLSSAVSEVA